jgi:hypothetical protein
MKRTVYIEEGRLLTDRQVEAIATGQARLIPLDGEWALVWDR